MPDLAQPQVRDGQPEAEGAVRGDHAGRGKMAIESGCQVSRHDVIVHEIGRCRDRRRHGGNLRRCAACGERFEEPGPPQRTGMVDRVPRDRVSHIRPVSPHGAFAPQPVAGRIDSAGCRAGPCTRAGDYDEGGHYARQ